MVYAEGILQAFIVDVVEDPLLIERLLELLAEPARLTLVPVDIIGATEGCAGVRRVNQPHCGRDGTGAIERLKAVRVKERCLKNVVQ
jgi:hypothetical protein